MTFPTTMDRDGRFAWVFGLLACVGLPFLSLLAPGITMITLGLRQRGTNPVAAKVGRNAAIFGAVNVGICIIYLAGLAVASAINPGGVTFESNPLLLGLFVIPLAAYLTVIGPLLNVILGIVALVRPVSPEKAAKILSRNPAA